MHSCQIADLLADLEQRADPPSTPSSPPRRRLVLLILVVVVRSNCFVLLLAGLLLECCSTLPIRDVLLVHHADDESLELLGKEE